MVPERKETNDTKPTITLVFHVGAFPNCSTGTRVQSECGSLRRQKSELGEAQVLGIFRYKY